MVPPGTVAGLAEVDAIIEPGEAPVAAGEDVVDLGAHFALLFAVWFSFSFSLFFFFRSSIFGARSQDVLETVIQYVRDVRERVFLFDLMLTESLVDDVLELCLRWKTESPVTICFPRSIKIARRSRSSKYRR